MAKSTHVPAQESQVPRRVGFMALFTLGVLTLLTVLSVMDRQVISLMVTPIKRDLGLSDVQISLIQGFAFVLCYATAAIPLGWAIDRLSRRLIMFIGVLLWSLSCSAAGFASGFWPLFMSRLGVGMGEATLQPGSYSTLSDLFPRERLSLVIGTIAVGNGGIGVFASFWLGGTIIGALSRSGDLTIPMLGILHPWQVTFLIFGAPGLILAFLLFAIAEPRRTRQHKPSASFLAPVMQFFARYPLPTVTLFVGYSLNNLLGNTIAAWSPAFFERRFGWHSSAIGPVLGVLFGSAGILGPLVVGLIADRCFRSGILDINFRTGIVALLVIAPVSAAAFLAPTAAMSLTMLAISFLAATACVPQAAAGLQMIAAPELRGRLAAVYLFFSNLVGAALGPLCVAALTDHVFHDAARVGNSLAIVVPIAAVLGAATLIAGRKAFGRAVVAAR